MADADTERFQGVIDALDQGNFWRKEINWVICMQTRTQSPFVRANLVKDWVDLYPDEVGNIPIGQCTTFPMSLTRRLLIRNRLRRRIDSLLP